MWPTPLAEAAERQSATMRRGNPTLKGAVATWPTPRAGEYAHGGPRQRGSTGDLMLTSAAHQALWPTPTASNPNDGETLASWTARRERLKARATNGNGMGTPLVIAVQQQDRRLWATPVASPNTNRATRHPPSAIGGTHGEQLASQVHEDTRANGTPATTGLILNPRWVACLMGYPTDWLTRGRPAGDESSIPASLLAWLRARQRDRRRRSSRKPT